MEKTPDNNFLSPESILSGSMSPESMSFGRYLKTVRLERGIELETVSEKTRITKGILLLIEAQDHDRLPAEVYVKGFLRSYAEAVGADSKEVIRLYMSQRDVSRKKSRHSCICYRILNIKAWPRILISFGLAGCIIALSSVFVISAFHGKQPANDILNHTALSKGKQNMEPDFIKSDISNRDAPIKQYAENIQNKLLLKIITVEKTWMKVIIDCQSPKKYSLNPGDRLEIEASSGFNLLIGNAGGVKLTLNGKPVSIPGKHGQVINLQIPQVDR